MNKCIKCNKEFKNKYNLTKHLNKKIQCNNIIKCDNCLTIFKTKQILTNHLNKKNKCTKVDLEKENIELKHKNEILQLTLNYKNNDNKSNINTNNSKLKENLSINMGNNKSEYGYVYIVSNLCYELQDIYKIGQTANKDSRLSGYNTGKMTKDRFKYLFIIETEHFIELEKLIFKYLEKNKVNNEMYKLKLPKIKKIIHLLNNNLINEKQVFNELL